MLSLFKDARVVALLLAATLTILSNSIISPALPGIEAAFDGTPNAALIVRLLVTAPALLVAAVAPFAGALADRFGKRRQLLIGVVLFAVTGSAGLWLDSLPAILISRMMLGIAVAFIMTAQTALIGDYFDGPTRGRFMGIQIAATNLGGFVFLLIAGALADQSAFWPFAIYLIALVYLPVFWMSLPEPHRPTAEERAQMPADDGEEGWMAKLIAVVTLGGLTFICFYLIPTQAPYFLATIGHPEPTAAALLLAIMMLSGGVFSLLYGRVRMRLGRAMTPALGYLGYAAAFGVLAISGNLATALVGSLLLGLAVGLVMPSLISIVLDVAPAHRRGFASGSVATSIFLGQFLSPLISAPVISAVGYSETFAIVAVLMICLSAMTVAFFRERRYPAYA